MTDRKQDIVERLRQDGRMSADLLDDAAAEIERLRSIIQIQDKWVPKPYCDPSGTSVRPYSLPRGFVDPRCPVKIHEAKEP